MTSADDTFVCPVCGTANRKKAFRCRECGETLPAGKGDQEAIRQQADENHPWHIEPDESYTKETSASAFLAQVALSAICVGLLVRYPGVGILISIIAFPVVILLLNKHTAVGSFARAVFMAVLCVGLIILALYIAFCAACLGILKGLGL